MRYGETVFVANSPEREDPGNPKYQTMNIPRMVGGLDGPSGDFSEALYAGALEEVVRVSAAEVAESGKLLGRVFRSVRTPLVDEQGRRRVTRGTKSDGDRSATGRCLSTNHLIRRQDCASF